MLSDTLRNRFRVTVQHGEGRSVYYVVDTAQPEAEQPAIVASFGTDRDPFGASARWLAQDYADRHNAK